MSFFPVGVIYSGVGKDEIMQFTGLKDKNGREIYEGDIVRYRDDNTQDKTAKVANVYWMRWRDWAHVPFLHPFGSPVAGKDVGESRSVNIVFVAPPEVCEVIGNIWENPDLLKFMTHELREDQKTPKTTFVCDRHGPRQSAEEQEDGCDICETTCAGCGGPKEPIAMRAAMASVGKTVVHLDPHRDCSKRLGSFWMKKACEEGNNGEPCRSVDCPICGKEVEPPDAMLSKDLPYV